MLSKEEISKIRYCNLHLHSHFSILDGVGTIKDHICENLHKGHEGVAITDHGVMSGCIQLYKLSKDKDFLKKIGRDSSIPVVMGSELYITRNVGEQNPENKYNHITVLAKNAKGYSNLCELTSIASTPDHFYYRPRIELKELIEHKEGLVVTSGCFIGMIPQAIHRDTGEEEELVQLFKKEFGDDFYIEIHISDISSKWDKTLKKHVNQGWNPQEKVNRRLIELAKKYDVKTIIAQDSHMPKKEHHFIQSIMIWNSPSGKDGWHFPEAYYTMSVQEMYDKSRKTTPYIDDDLFIESCNNSVEVLDKCKNCKLEFEPLLPTMKYDEHPVNCEPELNKKLEDQLNALEKEYAEKDHEFSYLLEKSHNDLALRTSLKVIMNNNKIDIHKQEYRERLTFETNTIQRNGILKLVDYFMLLEDVTKFVRESGNARGFGRGCLDRDALVLTQEHGYRKISEIKEGDHVYTKDGECKPVLMTFIYDVDQHETLLKISTEKSFGSITFTKNHKIYGIKPELTKKVMNSSSNHKIKKYNIKDNPEWIEAKDLSVNDFLFVSYPNREIINQEDVNLSKYVEFPYAVEGSDIVKLNPLTKREESRFSSMIKFDKEFSYFVGKWVGNGWITYDESRREYGVGIGFNSKDTIEINKMVSYLKNLGFTPKLIKSKTKSLTRLFVYNKVLSLYFKDQFSAYQNTSNSKYLGELKKLPNELLNQLLLGLQSADGHVGSGKNRGEMIDTTSKLLALEIKESLLYLNIPSSISVCPAFQSGKCFCKESYKIKFVGLKTQQKIKQNYKFENGYFVKILNIEEVSGVDKVFDLMVADSPSFLTSNYVVHNSGAGSLFAYALDITDVDPIRWKLLFERFLTRERIGRMSFEVPEVPKSGK